MFRNYLVTALRNLERNRLYAAISILGLTVAFTAALLIAQFVRNEFSYDHWIPGYRHVYQLTIAASPPGQKPFTANGTQSPLAGQLKIELPSATPARLMLSFPPLRRGPQYG